MLNIKNTFSKFISGGYGLPITFWILGVLIATVLGVATKGITTHGQWVFLAGIAIIHALLITIAVWNASKLYSGRSVWKWSAKLLVILSAAKWLWFLPDFLVTFLSAIGISIHSSEYWDLNARILTCEPALYQLTPESIQKRYEGCVYAESVNGEVINLRCKSAEINTEFFYTRNQNDCNKYLEKLQVLRKSQKSS